MRSAQAVWNHGLQFVGTSGSGHGIVIDTSPDEGGFGAGPSNTELLLMALCGCTGMDVVSILKKKRLKIEGFEVAAEGEVDEGPPKRLTSIHLTYRVRGDVSRKALEAAIELSHEKYCTISNSLRGAVEISHGCAIEPAD